MSYHSPSNIRSRAFPLWLKGACCAFLAFHLSVNLPYYGPLNYLWFCDVALLTGVLAICTENRLLLSMTALSVMGPATAWSIDFFCFLISGHYPLSIASYMSDPQLPVLVRAASTFHIWLPIVLVWIMSRIGYDRRALIYQTLAAILLLVVCRTMTAPPPSRSVRDVVNINGVYGSSDVKARTKFPAWVAAYTTRLPVRSLRITENTNLPAWIYVSWIIVKFWVFMYLPLHVMACLLFARRRPAGAHPKMDKLSWEMTKPSWEITKSQIPNPNQIPITKRQIPKDA